MEYLILDSFDNDMKKPCSGFCGQLRECPKLKCFVLCQVNRNIRHRLDTSNIPREQTAEY